MCKKLIKYLVEKLWDNKTFQEEVAAKIADNPVKWTFERFKKYISNKNGYTIVHTADQMVPYVFINEKEVRDKVAEWDKILAKAEEKQEVVKPKRKYTKRKKAVKE